MSKETMRSAMGVLEMTDRVVIVTGGAAGIGKATARRFAAAGARVAVWDLHPADEEAGTFQKVDVTDPAAVEAAAAEVVARWGRIDVLVNNAGIVKDAQLVRWKDGRQTGAMSEADFDAVIAVNLKGVFLCTRAVVPHLIAGGGGAILNASSVVGLYGNFGQTNYAATKAGVISLTQTWARELGRHNIRVNAVAPGTVNTEGMQPIMSVEQMSQWGAMLGRPTAEVADPRLIAQVGVFLLSDEAHYINGQILAADGGIMIRP